VRFSIRISAFIFATAAGIVTPFAQVPDAPTANPAAPAPAPTTAAPASGGAPATGAPKSGPTFLGRDIPSFDPGTEILSWDGKNWNVNNNRIFQARFEKYLNAPEETTAEDRQYQAIIAHVLQLLAPGNASRENVDTAFRLLARGSNFDIDARLCDALADAVYTVWAAQRQQQRLAMANETLEQERKKHEWNAKLSGERGSFEQTVTKSRKSGDSTNTTATKEVLTLTPYLTRLAETTARIKANEVKRELSEIQAKVEYQALIVQLFLQRRFQHVLMATRFYRAIFGDGDSKLNLGNDTKELFVRSAGMAPTVSTLDSLANEAIRDVREGIRAFEYLLSNDEMESATKRLAEAFTMGEYVTDIRTLPRTKKRRALEFAHKSNQLISALDVRDYGLAEKLVKEIRALAKDFDWSKPTGLIEAKKVEARFRVAAARNAALSGDRQTLEKELAAAAEVWPQNPELADISQKIFEQGDVQQKAIVDFDQLMSQKNFRQIFDNSARYLAATVLYPDRKTQLEEVLNNMRTIETAILRADEMRKQSNYAGAWESVETVAPQFPNDTKLNQVRADLTTQAADFVRTVRGAEDLEKRDQIGASLAWYLKAQKIYPASEFARSGIDRLKKKILPAE
jgi:tetratricopeptide (TPR) repeat protein